MNRHGVTRRSILKSGWSATTLALSGMVYGATSQSQASEAMVQPHEHDLMSDIAYSYMSRYEIPTLSVAIAKDGEIVYAERFGVVDPLFEPRITPSHLFRIADISKPITSVGIFTLVEQGRLSPTDRVFGEHGILSEVQLPANDRFIGEITLDHLLTHTVGGWRNSLGGGIDDPMFDRPDMDHLQLIAWMLENLPLSQPPGTRYAYSNFGYCLLGRVIEKITGQSYADYVRQSVLRPSQAEGMRIARNRLEERAEGEVVYHRQEGDVRGPYGLNVARMDSALGWLASPGDLVRFMINLEGTARTPGILKPETVAAMTTPSAVNPSFARGWNIAGSNRGHVGILPGTSAIMVRMGSGLCFAALANSYDRQHDSVHGLDKAVHEMVGTVKAWRPV
jgi:CubicO group peptidase (beta-lactamase class C family)